MEFSAHLNTAHLIPGISVSKTAVLGIFLALKPGKDIDMYVFFGALKPGEDVDLDISGTRARYVYSPAIPCRVV